jgi:hypothetical protein
VLESQSNRSHTLIANIVVFEAAGESERRKGRINGSSGERGERDRRAERKRRQPSSHEHSESLVVLERLSNRNRTRVADAASG